MPSFSKKTLNLFRVFLILFIVSIIWTFVSRNGLLTTEIKTHGGEYSEGIIGSPRFVNPVLAQSQADYDLTRLLFTPLVSTSHTGVTQYGLAESIAVSEDKLTYTIHLRNDLYFSDGVQVTADDVIFTIESIQDPLIKSPLYNKWQGVGVEKVDNMTLTIMLAQPFHDFMYTLEIGILPKHIWENTKPDEFIFSIYNSNPINIGPYVVKDIRTKENGVPESYVLKRNTESPFEPYVEYITLVFYEDEDAQIKALESGDIRAVYGISSEKMYQINTHKYEVIDDTLPRVFALFFNESKQDVLSNKVREAINLIIDKQVIINDVFNGYAQQVDTPTGENLNKQPNIEQAHVLIQEDGWQKNAAGMYIKRFPGSEDKNLQFSIAVPNLDEMISTAEHIQQQLREQGIQVIVTPYEEGALNQNVIRAREYESLLFGYEIEKPSDMFAFWHSSQISDPGLNVALFQDPRIDIELNKLRTTGDGDIQAITEAINTKNPAVFLYSPSYIYLLPKKVSVTQPIVTQGSDRFTTVYNWYIRTSHIWNIFLPKE